MDQQLRLARIVLESVDGPNQTITVDLVFQGNADQARAGILRGLA